MKKTILLILLVLPIVLLVIIAFAGRILSMYQHIPVERIEFVDKFNNVYTDEHTFTVEQGADKKTYILIYPELASNKKVTYTSSNEDICTVNKDGVIHGRHYGTADVIVKTDDGSRIATLHVKVKADVPFAVTLSKNELSLTEGEIYQLEADVDAPVAVDKNVTYSSSDNSIVRVDATGKVTAVSEGTATVTVTTVSGGVTDTCTVTVEKGVPPIAFDFSSIVGVALKGEYYTFTANPVINLAECIRVGEGINADNVVIKIQSGSGATLDGGVLTFTQAFKPITIRAYVGDETNPTAVAEVKLVFEE